MTNTQVEPVIETRKPDVPNPVWTVEVDSFSNLQWSQMLDLFDDANIYQTAAYGEVRWGRRNLSRLALRKHGRVVALAQLRIIRPMRMKFGMAYVRWGPIWERRDLPFDPEIPEKMVHALEEEYLRKRKLLLYVIPNAFIGTSRAEVVQAAFRQFRGRNRAGPDIYRTCVVDLSPRIPELRNRLDPKWRNKLSGAERNRLAIIAGNGPEEYRLFKQMYAEMKSRKSFESTVDVDEFGAIQELLPESQRLRVLICRDQGVPVSAIVVSAIGNSAIYLLGATSDLGLKSKGSYLLQWTSMVWLKERGIQWYDLGGIDPESNPGVYTFKKGLSGLDVVQTGPFVASRSSLSSITVRTGFALQSALDKFRGSPRQLQSGKQ